ncbi:MAG: dTDP-glucose 4,6-dehydratase [Fibromonadaceae bacterium]|jgi:dTDP-glucose 4,6-dehydratase|nr:dTDP-glucose 4,6-dehydratase [Fibromonadaceae bacterium]
MNILVTGCCGFIGTNFVKLVLKEKPDWNVANIDALTYAGNIENLKELEGNKRYNFFKGDIAEETDICGAGDLLTGKLDAIVHFAAESHVDNSIKNPGVFIRTNVEGTLKLLKYAKEKNVRFLQVSTDEVYGALGATGYFTEDTPLAPNSPYSASKASADFLVRAWHETYKLDTVITRCSNNYGPYQFPEKLIPLAVTNLMREKKIPVYGKGLNIRDWLHVEDHCRGILLALEKGEAGRVYNIGGNNEWKNIDIARELVKIMGLGEEQIEFVTDRLGHDFRYAIDATRIRKELGWEPKYTFSTGLPETVKWYKENETWWKPLKDRLQKK